MVPSGSWKPCWGVVSASTGALSVLSSEATPRGHHQDRAPRLAVRAGSRFMVPRAISPTRTWPSTPIHTLAPALAELTSREWDQGNEHFQPTTFQVSNLNAGTGAPNVIPGELKAQVQPALLTRAEPSKRLKQTVEGILRQIRRGQLHARMVRIRRTLLHAAGRPCRTAVCKAVATVAGKPPKLSTGGGTSDGRFIAPPGRCKSWSWV